jgi:EAL domain-containing protein (putative c-di-GMP-specific phosphodiesterase class I)
MPPGDFIELAEETGIVKPIGLQTLERAARQAVEWQRTVPHLEISVNVSPVQLRDPGFATVVSETLASVGLDPRSLMLEITESFLLEHTEACLDTLRELDSLGICLALDDFGTRYSSLGYLNSIPVKALKVDGSFVEHLGTNNGKTAIVAAIVAMAGSLGLSVIAEGVETVEQHRELVELGCRFGQGHLYARPMSLDAATATVRQLRLEPNAD